MVEPHSSNFRVITTNSLGVRTFRKFTVIVLFLDSFCENRLNSKCIQADHYNIRLKTRKLAELLQARSTMIRFILKGLYHDMTQNISVHDLLEMF